MKKILSLLSLAALTIGLLGSCSKINERIDSLEKRVDGIENEQIASINTQVEKINTSIADLGQIRSDITSLKQSAENHGQDISALLDAEETLRDRILTLENYLDDVLPTFAETEWVEATFSTLEQYEATCDTIAKIDARIGALDEKLSKDIQTCADALKTWVNGQFEGYYTAAEADAIVENLQAQIDSVTQSDPRIDSLAAELTATKAAIETAKEEIRTEYKSAITSAITQSEGKMTVAINRAIAGVNSKITGLIGDVNELKNKVGTLTANVNKLLAMIQSVSITPAYSDGSVEADENGILTLKCIVKPAEALSGMESLKDSLLIYADFVKVKTKAASAYMEIKVSEATVTDAKQGAITLKADIKEYLPKGADKTLTVALYVKNGISDFTTEFVPVYATASEPLPGVFSVSTNKKVKFSKGNLVATIDASGTPTAWKFATNQYDYLGAEGANKTIGYGAGDIDLFGWSTASTTYGISTSTTEGDYSGDFVDWGKAYCENNNITPDNTWRTLTTAEWQYLFNTRTVNGGTGAGKSYSLNITYGGKKGVVLYPDDYTGSVLYGTVDSLPEGVVFLVAAGERRGFDVVNVGYTGYYWSSTASGSIYAYLVGFNKSDFVPNYTEYRYTGNSVRLITEVK